MIVIGELINGMYKDVSRAIANKEADVIQHLAEEQVKAGAAILEALGLKEEGRYKPQVFSSSVIRRIDDYHTMLINRMRHGNMILPGHTLFTMEVAPAAYAAFAANEAEKAAEINILEIRAFGSFGRIYLGGEEKDIDVASKAAETAINSITGREMKGSGG